MDQFIQKQQLIDCSYFESEQDTITISDYFPNKELKKQKDLLEFDDNIENLQEYSDQKFNIDFTLDQSDDLIEQAYHSEEEIVVQTLVQTQQIESDKYRQKSLKLNNDQYLDKARHEKLSQYQFFYFNEKIPFSENEFIEFKNYKLPLLGQQMLKIKETVCGFLNTGGGRLYIGVNDQKQQVQGMYLNLKSKDKFIRYIDDCLIDVSPKIHFQ